MAHMRYLCKDYNINISSQKNYGVGYNEPRLDDRDELLMQSYQDALNRWTKSVSDLEKMFIIEDTSVKIDALSTAEKEIPGLDIKYWMKEHTFDDVDVLLKQHGNNRKCTVRSDIIVHLPQSLHKRHKKTYLHFTSSTEGQITEEEYSFDTNAIYPWLDNTTFNKWFIPNGSIFPLGMLPIDDAEKYDFRKQAVVQMLDILELEKIIKPVSEIVVAQQKIINFSPMFILCGPTCAGKSTLAAYLSNNYNYFHIEASDFMRLKYFETHGVHSSVDIGEFATTVLADNPYIVTEQIIEYFQNINDQPIVVSGFRNPLEVKYMLEHSQYGFMELVYIEANILIRFHREQTRARDDIKDFAAFQKKDTLQHALGLPAIRQMLDEPIVNEDTLDEFYEDVLRRYQEYFDTETTAQTLAVPKFEKLTLEQAIVLALYNHQEEAYTTTQIAKIIDEEIMVHTYKDRKNNVSRYFNQYYHPYFDIDVNQDSGIKRYQINSTGISMAKRILYKNKEKESKTTLSKIARNKRVQLSLFDKPEI